MEYEAYLRKGLKDKTGDTIIGEEGQFRNSDISKRHLDFRYQTGPEPANNDTFFGSVEESAPPTDFYKIAQHQSVRYNQIPFSKETAQMMQDRPNSQFEVGAVKSAIHEHNVKNLKIFDAERTNTRPHSQNATQNSSKVKTRQFVDLAATPETTTKNSQIRGKVNLKSMNLLDSDNTFKYHYYSKNKSFSTKMPKIGETDVDQTLQDQLITRRRNNNVIMAVAANAAIVGDYENHVSLDATGTNTSIKQKKILRHNGIVNVDSDSTHTKMIKGVVKNSDIAAIYKQIKGDQSQTDSSIRLIGNSNINLKGGHTYDVVESQSRETDQYELSTSHLENKYTRHEMINNQKLYNERISVMMTHAVKNPSRKLHSAEIQRFSESGELPTTQLNMIKPGKLKVSHDNNLKESMTYFKWSAPVIHPQNQDVIHDVHMEQSSQNDARGVAVNNPLDAPKSEDVYEFGDEIEHPIKHLGHDLPKRLTAIPDS